MQSIPCLLLFPGVPDVRERMLESLEEGQLETVCACLIKKKKGGRKISHMQRTAVTTSANDLWGWKGFDDSVGPSKESL